MYYDFSEDAATLARIDSYLIDSIFCAISNHKRMPNIPDFIQCITIKAYTGYDFKLSIVTNRCYVEIDRYVLRRIFYKNKDQVEIEINETVKLYDYAWATIEMGGVVENLRPSMNCDNGIDLVHRAMTGERAVFQDSGKLLYEMTRLAITTRTGARGRLNETQFSIKAFLLRKLFNSVFARDSKVKLK